MFYKNDTNGFLSKVKNSNKELENELLLKRDVVAVFPAPHTKNV